MGVRFKTDIYDSLKSPQSVKQAGRNASCGRGSAQVLNMMMISGCFELGNVSMDVKPRRRSPTPEIRGHLALITPSLTAPSSATKGWERGKEPFFITDFERLLEYFKEPFISGWLLLLKPWWWWQRRHQQWIQWTISKTSSKIRFLFSSDCLKKAIDSTPRFKCRTITLHRDRRRICSMWFGVNKSIGLQSKSV